MCCSEARLLRNASFAVMVHPTLPNAPISTTPTASDGCIEIRCISNSAAYEATSSCVVQVPGLVGLHGNIEEVFVNTSGTGDDEEFKSTSLLLYAVICCLVEEHQPNVATVGQHKKWITVNIGAIQSCLTSTSGQNSVLDQKLLTKRLRNVMKVQHVPLGVTPALCDTFNAGSTSGGIAAICYNPHYVASSSPVTGRCDAPASLTGQGSEPMAVEVAVEADVDVFVAVNTMEVSRFRNGHCVGNRDFSSVISPQPHDAGGGAQNNGSVIKM